MCVSLAGQEKILCFECTVSSRCCQLLFCRMADHLHASCSHMMKKTPKTLRKWTFSPIHSQSKVSSSWLLLLTPPPNRLADADGRWSIPSKRGDSEGSLLFQVRVTFIEAYLRILTAAAVKWWDYGWMLLPAGNNRPARGGSINCVNMHTVVSHRRDPLLQNVASYRIGLGLKEKDVSHDTTVTFIAILRCR